jgi:hypothetical protein
MVRMVPVRILSIDQARQDYDRTTYDQSGQRW